jgi:hypothetical protein
VIIRLSLLLNKNLLREYTGISDSLPIGFEKELYQPFLEADSKGGFLFMGFRYKEEV